MVECEYISYAEACAGQHIRHSGYAIEKRAAWNAATVHIICEQCREQRADHGDYQRIYHAAHNRRSANAPKLVPMVKRE